MERQCQKLGNIFTGPTSKLLLSFAVSLDDCRPIIGNKTSLTKYCPSHVILKIQGSFEIHCLKQNLANWTALAGIANTTVCKTETIMKDLWHGKSS